MPTGTEPGLSPSDSGAESIQSAPWRLAPTAYRPHISCSLRTVPIRSTLQEWVRFLPLAPAGGPAEGKVIDLADEGFGKLTDIIGPLRTLVRRWTAGLPRRVSVHAELHCP